LTGRQLFFYFIFVIVAIQSSTFLHDSTVQSTLSARISGKMDWFDCWDKTKMSNTNYLPDFISNSDKQLLDAYSGTVTGVVKNASQVVVHIKVLKTGIHPGTKKPIDQEG